MTDKNGATATGKNSQHEIHSIYNSPVFKSFMAGAISGTCSAILFQPLDLVKTRLQKSDNVGLGMFAAIRNVVRQEKITGLWNGLIPSLVRCVPGIGFHFASLHWLKSTFGSENPHPFESALIGASARTIAGILVLPVTVMKTRYESGDFHYSGLLQALRLTYRKEGFRGLYSGLGPTMLRDVPFSGIYYMFYSQLRTLTRDKQTFTAPYIHFTNGILASCLASLVTQPADVIKTYMQLNPQKYAKFSTVIIYIYTELGLVGFWRGIVPRTVRRTLMSAMSWTVYEEIMRACNIKT
ncbi:mitochondrial glycine transporter A-like [Physella acuta]|uniref:mitochondrial glycine transporter A-like n=1 Tax=Physella acuta TaxID=109671 RepID=UPI0027DCC9F9|nr:mitochondrial glycine transporter A-like [Physella acuta]XP_059178463.1 mitochondrial glycine transporter A-like [Physella acuta]